MNHIVQGHMDVELIPIQELIEQKLEHYFPEARVAEVRKQTGTVWSVSLESFYCWHLREEHPASPPSPVSMSVSVNGILPKCQHPDCRNRPSLTRIPCFSTLEKSRYFGHGIAQHNEDPIEEEAVNEYNAKFAHVIIGDDRGELIVVQRETDDPVMGGTKMKFFSETNFLKRFRHDVTTDGRQKAALWLQSPRHPILDEMVFLPGETDTEQRGWFNLWTGWPVESHEGDVDESDPDLVMPMTFLREIVACGDADSYEYLLNWLAFSIQKPHEPVEIILALRGLRGIGKSFFANMIGHLFGIHYKSVGAKQLLSNFNSHVNQTVFLFADEASGKVKSTHREEIMSLLQDLATAKFFWVNMKFVEPFRVRNSLHIVMASNFRHMVTIGHDARRFCFFDVSDARKNDEVYFSKLQQSLTPTFYSKFLSFLRKRDISGWKRTQWPSQSEKPLWENKLASLEPIEQWLYRFLRDEDAFAWKPVVSQQSVIKHLEGFRGRSMRGSRAQIEDVFERIIGVRIIPGERKKHIYPGGKKLLAYYLPPLDECREKFQQYVETSAIVLWHE